MSRKLPLARDEAARTACARILVRSGIDDKTGEVLSSAVVTERVGWCADLVRDMAARLLASHWNRADADVLAAGRDAAGRPLPAAAWMALRRLGWAASTPGPHGPAPAPRSPPEPGRDND